MEGSFAVECINALYLFDDDTGDIKIILPNEIIRLHSKIILRYCKTVSDRAIGDNIVDLSDAPLATKLVFMLIYGFVMQYKTDNLAEFLINVLEAAKYLQADLICKQIEKAILTHKPDIKTSALYIRYFDHVENEEIISWLLGTKGLNSSALVKLIIERHKNNPVRLLAFYLRYYRGEGLLEKLATINYDALTADELESAIRAHASNKAALGATYKLLMEIVKAKRGAQKRTKRKA